MCGGILGIFYINHAHKIIWKAQIVEIQSKQK